MWDLIDKRADATPDACFLIDGATRTLSFAELRSEAESVAAGLMGLGVTAESVVSWQLPTRIDTVILSAAISRIGAVQNPIIHLYREREVGHALRQSETDLFCIPGTFRGTDFTGIARNALSGATRPPQILVVDDGLPRADRSILPPAPAPADDATSPIRWIYYTSGSTADPKGVLHTDHTLIAGAHGLSVALEMSKDDVGSMAFPIAHIGGADYITSMLEVGYRAVLLDAFVMDESLPIFRKHGVTMVGGSTAFYIAFLAEQRKNPDVPILATLRAMTGGGAPKPPELHYEALREVGGRGTVHGYGMTEAPMMASGSPSDTDEQLAYSDGAPVTGCSFKIVRLDGRVADVEEEGELRVKGPMVCKGYSDPTLTEEAFDEEGYFRTGDLGKRRADGHICVTGRIKDVIVRKGENVSAIEVESVLYEHPAIAEVAVIGLPDKVRGEKVCAVVEVKPGMTLTLEDVVAFCKGAGLMIQKIPEQLELRDDWPRAGTGKVLKKELKAQYSL